MRQTIHYDPRRSMKRSITQSIQQYRAQVFTQLRSLAYSEPKTEEFEGLANRFRVFCDRYERHFLSGSQVSRSPELPFRDYLSGLFQSRKRNIERMVEKVPDSDYEAAQYMISEAGWSEEAVFRQIGQEADHLLGGPWENCFIIDESGFPKSGTSSVGVRRQWCGRLGKVENCQVGVYGALACREQTCLVDSRLFLPESWTKDPARCLKAGVPQECAGFQSKAALALGMVQRARRNGLRFQWVGADSFYGQDPWFLRQLEQSGELFVVDVHKDQRVYLQDPDPRIPPSGGQGRPPSR